MRVAFIGGLAACLVSAAGFAQRLDRSVNSGFVVGGAHYVAAGAAAILARQYDDGIRLTKLGLETDELDDYERAAGLANICSAYVSKREPDVAIPYCNESLEINDRNWKTYSARSEAYLLKGMYSEAAADNRAAAALAPEADHVRMIAGLINEATLLPRVTAEDHQ